MSDLKAKLAEVVRQHNQELHDEEAAKTHPLSAFSLDPQDWADLKAHMLDGGGVVDDSDLCRTFIQALMDDNQPVFWPALAHLIKAWLKIRGHVQQLPGGGVKFNGVAPR